jgi:hypothetical protein
VENKYSDGTPARRGDVVLIIDDEGSYVILDPKYSAGFVFVAQIENPVHFTRKARIERCRKQTPSKVERQRAAEVMARIAAAKRRLTQRGSGRKARKNAT